MEINKTDDETLKKIAAEIRATGVSKKKTQNKVKLGFLQKLEKSVISPNHKEVIQRIMRVDKRNSRQIEDKHTETNFDEIIKLSQEISTKIPNIEVQYSDGKPISEDLRKSTFTKREIDNIKNIPFLTEQVSADEELASPSFDNQFMNDEFLSNSSIVLNKSTALNQNLCTDRHIDIGKYYIDEDDIRKCEETNKEELMCLFNLETILKKYTNDSDFNILLLSEEALEELIKEANDNGEQIKELDVATKKVKRKLYRKRKCTDGFYDCV